MARIAFFACLVLVSLIDIGCKKASTSTPKAVTKTNSGTLSATDSQAGPDDLAAARKKLMDSIKDYQATSAYKDPKDPNYNADFNAQIKNASDTNGVGLSDEALKAMVEDKRFTAALASAENFPKDDLDFINQGAGDSTDNTTSGATTNGTAGPSSGTTGGTPVVNNRGAGGSAGGTGDGAGSGTDTCTTTAVDGTQSTCPGAATAGGEAPAGTPDEGGGGSGAQSFVYGTGVTLMVLSAAGVIYGAGRSVTGWGQGGKKWGWKGILAGSAAALLPFILGAIMVGGDNQTGINAAWTFLTFAGAAFGASTILGIVALAGAKSTAGAAVEGGLHWTRKTFITEFSMTPGGEAQARPTSSAEIVDGRPVVSGGTASPAVSDGTPLKQRTPAAVAAGILQGRGHYADLVNESRVAVTDNGTQRIYEVEAREGGVALYELNEEGQRLRKEPQFIPADQGAEARRPARAGGDPQRPGRAGGATAPARRAPPGAAETGGEVVNKKPNTAARKASSVAAVAVGIGGLVVVATFMGVLGGLTKLAGGTEGPAQPGTKEAIVQASDCLFQVGLAMEQHLPRPACLAH